jgi:hypothetical protein
MTPLVIRATVAATAAALLLCVPFGPALHAAVRTDARPTSVGTTYSPSPPIIGSLACASPSPYTGAFITVSAVVTDPNGDLASVGVDWDDGVGAVAATPAADGTLSAKHRYPAAGTYHVLVSALDGGGMHSEATCNVVIYWAGSPSFTTFNVPGTQNFTVPTGVTRVNVIVIGGRGGVGGAGGGQSFAARVEATLVVTQGMTLTARIGGNGGHYSPNYASAPGGFNGGGSGSPDSVQGGGGGGGASDVRDSSGTRLIVAGGGGGAGGPVGNNGVYVPGGAGGNGDYPGVSGSNSATGGGQAGSIASGGAPGQGSDGGSPGTAGTSGAGGSGGAGSGSGSSGGGGGGGGYYGGGGGAGGGHLAATNYSGSGGGGGSSYLGGGFHGVATTDTTGYPIVTFQYLAMQRLDQIISLQDPGVLTYGMPDFTPAGGASSGLPVGFGASGACNMVDGKVHVWSIGSCYLVVVQQGDADWMPVSVSRTFSVGKGNQTIDFPAIADHPMGGADFSAGASSSSGLAVSYAASGSCSTAAGQIHLAAIGSCTVTASQPGDSNFNAAADFARTFNVTKQQQTITFAAPTSKTYGSADFAAGATASSGLAVIYSATGACSMAGVNIRLNAAGACTVTASQAGDATYAAAPDVSNTFTVASAGTSVGTLTVTLVNSNPTAQFGDGVSLRATVSAATTATGNGVFTGSLLFRVNGKPSLGVSAAVSNSAPTATVSLRLDDAVLAAGGTYSVSADFVPAAASNYGASSNAAQTIVVKGEGLTAAGAKDGSTRLEYAGSASVAGGVAPSLIARIRQSLSPEASDNQYIDYGRIPVSAVFNIYQASCTTKCLPVWTSLVVRFANSGDWLTTGIGTAQTTGPTTLAKGTYRVEVSLSSQTLISADLIAANLSVGSGTGGFLGLGEGNDAIRLMLVGLFGLIGLLVVAYYFIRRRTRQA